MKKNTKKISDQFGYISKWNPGHEIAVTTDKRAVNANTKECVTKDFSSNAKLNSLNSLSPNAECGPSTSGELELKAANDRCDTMLGSLLTDQFLAISFGTLLPLSLQSINLAQTADLLDQFWMERTANQSQAVSRTSQYQPSAPAHAHRPTFDYAYTPAFC